MADVKIIDIDSEQWNMKDQKARDDIAALEQKTTTKTKNLWKSGASFLELVTINDAKFLHLHLQGFRTSGNYPKTLFSFQNDFGLTIGVRGQGFYDDISIMDRVACGFDFSPQGTVLTYPLSKGLYSGTWGNIDFYADCFIKVI